MQQYVFLDECGVSTDLLRRYGRSPRGTRLHDHTPCGHWQTHTVIAGLRAIANQTEPLDEVITEMDKDLEDVKLALEALVAKAGQKTA